MLDNIISIKYEIFVLLWVKLNNFRNEASNSDLCNLGSFLTESLNETDSLEFKLNQSVSFNLDWNELYLVYFYFLINFKNLN